LGWLGVYLCQHFANVGQPDPAAEATERARALAAECRDVRLAHAASYYLGLAYAVAGEYEAACATLRESIDPTEHAHDESYALRPVGGPVPSRAWLAFCLGQRGEFVEGRLVGEEGFRIAEATSLLYMSVQASWGLGHLLLAQGDSTRAIPVLERGLDLCRTSANRLYGPGIAAALALAYSRVDRTSEAVALVQPLADAAHMARTWFRGHVLVALGAANLAGDRVTDADLLAERALDHARAHRDRGGEAWAQRLLAEASDRGASSHSAERGYREALNLATELGMRPLVAHCHLGLGTLYRRMGDPAKAHEHLSTAATMYRDMGMGFWLEKAEAALGPPQRNSP
jgi:tetratricopeptide (TPR) repeat protein